MVIKNKFHLLPMLILFFFIIFISFVVSEEPAHSGTKELIMTTDKQEYEIGETVRITIQNNQDKAVDICCLSFCTLGNFPTKIEVYKSGEWKFSCGHCLLLERFFKEEGVSEQTKGKYFICYKFPKKDSFEFEINDFCKNQHLNKNDRVRITYYQGRRKIPIHSNEFTIR